MQRAVNAYVDRCAKQTTDQPVDCPFGTDETDNVRTDDHDYVTDLTDVHWKVVTYPVIYLNAAAGGFDIIDRDQAEVRLSATGRDLGSDKQVRFAVDCPMDLSRLTAVINSDHEISVEPPSALLETQEPEPVWTCGTRP